MNCLGWLDLYIATSTMDNNAMNPSTIHTTVVRENTAESRHQQLKSESKNSNRDVSTPQSRLSKISN